VWEVERRVFGPANRQIGEVTERLALSGLLWRVEAWYHPLARPHNEPDLNYIF